MTTLTHDEIEAARKLLRRHFSPRAVDEICRLAKKGLDTEGFDAEVPIRHIGILYALCDRRKRASLREDLGAERYRQLGVTERFKNEAPYRICSACIARVEDDNFMATRWLRNQKQRQPTTDPRKRSLSPTSPAPGSTRPTRRRSGSKR